MDENTNSTAAACVIKLILANFIQDAFSVKSDFDDAKK